MTIWSEASRGFSGQIEAFPLTSVLQILELGKKSGFLYLREFPKVAFLVMHNGAIVQSATSLRRSGLGELLLAERLIREEDLSQALNMQRLSPKKQILGKLFIEMGYVDQQQITDILLKQMKEIVVWILKWQKGEFTFYAEQREESEWAADEAEELVLPVGVVVQEVLQEMIVDADRRRHPRAPVSFKVVHHSGSTSKTYYTRDVSEGGLFVLAEECPAIGEMLELELWVPKMIEATPVLCRVVRVVEAGQNQASGFGVQFEQIDEQSRQLLKRLGETLGNLL